MFAWKIFAAGLAVCVVILALLAALPPVRAADNSCQLTWEKVTPPDTGAEFAELKGVDAISANDVWAVGDVYGGTLIEHWNGSAWQVIPSPNPNNGRGHLNGVSGTSANDVWAVGSVSLNSTDQSGLMLHWDGTAWNIVALPPIAGNSFALNAVHAIATNDVWAVGWHQENSAYQNLTLHWDGSVWGVVPSPTIPDTISALRGVSASASNDVWAVGYGVLHWDGAQWNLVSDALGGDDIVALAPNDVWLPFWHWDGAQWTYFPPENYSGKWLAFVGIDAVATDSVYVVGYEMAPKIAPSASQHWNGTQWRAMQMPGSSALYPRAILYDVSMASANEGWAVGEEFDMFGSSIALIMHATAPCIEPTRVPDTPTPPPTPTPVLNPPRLLAPKDGATVNKLRPLLDWRDVLGAQFYRVVVTETITGAKQSYKPTSSQQRTQTLCFNATYEWRVKACVMENGKQRCGKWSRPFSFTVRAP